MRKKTFLKAVSLFACLSILMLSVPGVIASERTPKKFSYFNRLLEKSTDTLSLLLPFLNLRVNDKGGTSSDQTYNDDSGQKIKATGVQPSVKPPRGGDS